ncbi:uncharacterized protein [Dermacentor andersoni]|uniref:uncharacterized protein n=1 Tax=Dermacentor andersoni TaxID=34620 RepID=UPI003B3B0343
MVHSVKLDRRSESTRPYRAYNRRTTVYNLSSHSVDPAEASVLELGLNFNVAPAPDVRKVVCAVECAVNQVDPSRRDEARTRAIGVLSGLHRRKFVSPLSTEERKAVKRLKANTAIVILPADKGNATVLTDTAVYKNKMLALLNDQDTYVRLTRDPTLKVQRDFQTLLADVFRFVAPKRKSLYFKLLCHNGAAPALYGLPKVHKPNVPLRPIVDYTRSPLYKLSAYLHQLLAPLVGKSSTHVSNSCDFIEKVRDVSLDDDEVMVSFDVVSLFTSIPTDLAVEACTSALESDRTLPDRSPIDVRDLKRLLCFCLGNRYFCFDKVFYRQIHEQNIWRRGWDPARSKPPPASSSHEAEPPTVQGDTEPLQPRLHRLGQRKNVKKQGVTEPLHGLQRLAGASEQEPTLRTRHVKENGWADK